MKIKYLFYVLVFVFFGCTKTNDKEIEAYFRSSGDSFCLYAYLHLREQLSQEKLECLTIDKSFLVQDIERAVSTYKRRLKTSYIPFSVFEEYLLPPILEDEPLENWREKCEKNFSFMQTWNITAVCDTLNLWMSKGFSFNYGETPARYLSWSHLDTLQKGDCFHMAKSVLYPLRALGYPCTIDFVPCWGNTTGGHSWNVVYLDGKMVPFMGREKGVYAYDPFRIYDFKDPRIVNPARYPGKVYRKTFSVDKELQRRFKHVPVENLPSFFSDYRIKDVTSEYLQVSNVSVKVADTVPVDEPVYLAVLSDDWMATAYTESNNERMAFFKDVKSDMLYMAVVYRRGNVFPVNDPFIVNEEGRIRFLNPDSAVEMCVVSYLLPLMREYSTAVANKDRLPKDIFNRLYTGEARKRPTNGDTYSLFYWKGNRWQYLDTRIAKENHIVFPMVPQNALFHLADKNNRFIGRCFTLNKGEMVWW